MRNAETGLDYARFDQSDTRIRQAQYRHTPSWRGAWLYCLKHFDYEAADLIYDRNKVSDECEEGEHGCAYRWCKCSCHSAVQFRELHPELRSLLEAQSDQEEAA